MFRPFLGYVYICLGMFSFFGFGMLFLHDSSVVLLGPIRKQGADDAPEEVPIRKLIFLHLIHRQVIVHLTPTFDQGPDVFYSPVVPMLAHIQHADV